MFRTHSTILIPAPPSEVFALLSDPGRTAEMGTRRVEIVSRETTPDGRPTTHVRTRGASGSITEGRTERIEKIEDELIVTRSVFSPAALARFPRLRFGSVELERTIRLTADRDGTVLAIDFEWRFRPAPLHLYTLFLQRGRIQRLSDNTARQIRGQFLKFPTADAPSPAP